MRSDDDGRLVLSPTDLTRRLACAHLTTLDLLAARGQLPRPQVDDEALDLVLRLGTEHERDHLTALRESGRSVVHVPTAFGATDRAAARERTLAAMRDGVDVIYQATLDDPRWGGQADFLLRVDQPSRLGAWSYEVADTKLARRLAVPALLQLAVYARSLGRLQDRVPDHVHVVTGDGAEHAWRTVDVLAYADRVRARLEAEVDRPLDPADLPTTPVPVPHCGRCRWHEHCRSQWVAQDDVCLVAGVRTGHRARLVELGIPTVRALADADPAALTGLGTATARRLVQQARLQVDERTEGTAQYALLDPHPGTGLLRLPPPSPGDLYLDFEGDPYYGGGAGLEYLAGVGDRSGGFTALWALDPAAEARMVAELVDLLHARRREQPDLHVYHYAPYETAALKRLTARHGVREAELDQLLRAEVFVDLYTVVKQGLQIGKESYSLKKLEALYWGHVRAAAAADGEVADALASVVAFERWLVQPDAETLPQIEKYNREDVFSTLALHDWLEQRRTELEATHGPQPRPAGAGGEQVAEPSPDERAEADLAERLRAGGRPLLADLVQWHRRELRPQWWEVFRRRDLRPDQLVEDRAALGGLAAPTAVGTVARSTLWEFTFPPQDCALSVGKPATDVVTTKGLGTVAALDPVAGRLVLKLGTSRSPAGVTALGPPNPLLDTVLRQSLRRLGEAVLAGGGGLGRALLERRVLPGTVVREGESAADAVVRLGRALDGQVLAVQGPPGTGKTWAGARLIRALLDDGLRVGVVANSHAVIGNLLTEVGRPALQKCEPEKHCGATGVEQTDDNAEVARRLADGTATLVGGTAWLWARPELEASVDALVVDEAGQLSLANAVAVAQCARSMVLLGDPQQLSQPSQGMHPPGAGVSALEHLLDGHETIPDGRGIFLPTTYRMHPTIAEFVGDLAYEGRLAAAPGRERQAVAGWGSGLRYVPVEHAGNASASAQEAVVVAGLVADLLARTWTDHDGVEHPLTLDDVLVVAPYNAHVARLREALPDGARVGTVDLFQGRQAAVVLYSMSSSSAADAPRGVDFLYDVHRFTVALSRAKALAVVVASPALLDAAVHSPGQLRAVNALCRFVARSAGSPSAPTPHPR